MADQQNNLMAMQATQITEITRVLRATPTNPTTPGPDEAIGAAEDFIARGVRSLEADRAVRAHVTNSSLSPGERNFLVGVNELMQLGRDSEIAYQIENQDSTISRQVSSANAAFGRARRAPEFARWGILGQAYIQYLTAAGNNYRFEDCSALFDLLAEVEPALPEQPLYWRAQCSRKLGRVADAANDYARVLEQNIQRSADEDVTALEMIATHGLGTTLIALPLNGEGPAYQVARRLCVRASDAPDSLSIACLETAIDMRLALGQTLNEVAGSAENIGLVHLRRRDFRAAFDHANEVERTGLFAWNEVIRAVAGERLDQHSAADRINLQLARRNIRNFSIGAFNICELQSLLDPDLFEEVVNTISRQRPKDVLTCIRP